MTNVTFVLPAKSAFTFTDGFAADYIAPEEIQTRIDYVVLDPSGTQVEAGAIADSETTEVNLGASPQSGIYTVQFTATHFDAKGDGLSSPPISQTLTIDVIPPSVGALTVTLEAPPLGVKTSITASDDTSVASVVFQWRETPSGTFTEAEKVELTSPSSGNTYEYEQYTDKLRYNREYEFRATVKDDAENSQERLSTVTTGQIPAPSALVNSTPVAVTFS